MDKPKPISRDVGRFCFANYIAGDPSSLPGTSAISFARSPAGVLVKPMKDEVSDPEQRSQTSLFCRAGVQRDAIPLCRVEGGKPHQVKGRCPCPVI